MIYSLQKSMSNYIKMFTKYKKQDQRQLRNMYQIIERIWKEFKINAHTNTEEELNVYD